MKNYQKNIKYKDQQFCWSFIIESESDNIGLFPNKEKISNEDKALNNIKKTQTKKMSKHTLKNKMKKRIKNSQVFTNIKDIDDDGLINLKSGEVAS